MKILLAFYTLSSIQKCQAQPMRFLQYEEERSPGNGCTLLKKKKKTFGNIFKKESLTEVDLDTTDEWGIQHSNNIAYSCTIQQ